MMDVEKENKLEVRREDERRGALVLKSGCGFFF